ncbi:MAG: c-type cytochrome [Rubripirellula sp.]|nr:c-type cytochrome [Rubripirellula sp.]
MNIPNGIFFAFVLLNSLLWGGSTRGYQAGGIDTVARILASFCFFAFLSGSWQCPAQSDADGQNAAAEPVTEVALFGEGIRPTPWLTPQAEKAGFHLPPGFEIRLFASEPQIAKPLNMAFDARGRLWITQSLEYPYPTSEGQEARDAVMVLEDTDQDGSADRFTKFADGLNIPMGLIPYRDGCICFSIPNLWFLRDTDNDGVCDHREVILGPFDTSRDTHGMINALRDGGDGWIYACHGFNNQSEVTGKDGHTITMKSGNTFRFRPDGSRVEHVTHGQVNPFGMTQDQWGYRYSADCHSKPITQLVRGAHYPSFGAPHDGLGFLPAMMDHLHGSTAICGLAYFPPKGPLEPLRGQMISGNVMTSRINRNQVSYEGATARGTELPDFLTCDDPWFRPVDIQLGLDGHIYVADFYNKIIGHYEVPLDHPDRDRTSGRIWQIRYRGASSVDGGNSSNADFSSILWQQGRTELERLAALRSLALQQPIDQEHVVKLLTDHSLLLRVAAMNLASELLVQDLPQNQKAVLLRLARNRLTADNPHLQRAAAELIGLHGDLADTQALFAVLADVPGNDVVLRQTLKIAIRSQLQAASDSAEIWKGIPSEEMAMIIQATEHPRAADALLRFLREHPESSHREAMLSHAIKQVEPDVITRFVDVVREIVGRDLGKQQECLKVLYEAQSLGTAAVPASLRTWGIEVVDRQLIAFEKESPKVTWSVGGGEMWRRESRQLAGGGQTLLISSLSHGEKYTGQLVTASFPAPPVLSFRLAGHNGFPGEPDHGKNVVRLIRASDGRVLREANPPRNDVAKLIRWDLADVQGQNVRLECVDGDAASAYAWLAVGEFEPGWIAVSQGQETLRDALQWIGKLKLVERLDRLRGILASDISMQLRSEVARTVAEVSDRLLDAIALQYLSVVNAPADLVDEMILASLSENRESMLQHLKTLCKRMSASQQNAFAVDWAKQRVSIETLLYLTDEGVISPAVLVDPTVAQALNPRLSENEQERVRLLTQGLNINAERAEHLTQLQVSLAGYRGNRQVGKTLYTKHCAACHQLRGEGSVVGPQLDGAASRSVDRLLEDLLIPDRNVDRAFRTTSFLMEDGRVVVGLVVEESAEATRVVESNGKAVMLDPDAVEQRRDNGRSLMPGNMHEVLTREELGDLIGFIRES